jgi:hypothetical protein
MVRKMPSSRQAMTWLFTSAEMAPFPVLMVLFVKSTLKGADASRPPIEHLSSSNSAFATAPASTPAQNMPVAAILAAHAATGDSIFSV